MSTPEPYDVRDRRLPPFAWQDRRVAQLYIGQLGAEAFGLYCYLTHFRNGSNQCWPSLKTLEGALGWTRNTLKKYLRRLVRARLIRVERIAFQNDRGKRWQGYQFTILDLDTGTPRSGSPVEPHDGCQNLTPVHTCAPAQTCHGYQNLTADGCQNLTPNKIYMDLEENTQNARAREDDTLVAHEPPVDAPQAPEDETPCVCEDESPAEEPEAPGADPEPEPQAVPGPEPPPEPEVFAWEEPTCTYDPIVPCRHYRATLAAIEPLVPFRVTGNGQRVHEEVFEAAHRLSPEHITRIYRFRIAEKHRPEVLYPSVTLARKSLDKWHALAEAWEPDVPPPPPPCPHDTWDLHWEGNRQRCKCGEVVGEGVDPEVMRADVERFAPSWEEPPDAA